MRYPAPRCVTSRGAGDQLGQVCGPAILSPVLTTSPGSFACPFYLSSLFLLALCLILSLFAPSVFLPRFPLSFCHLPIGSCIIPCSFLYTHAFAPLSAPFRSESLDLPRVPPESLTPGTSAVTHRPRPLPVVILPFSSEQVPQHLQSYLFSSLLDSAVLSCQQLSSPDDFCPANAWRTAGVRRNKPSARHLHPSTPPPESYSCCLDPTYRIPAALLFCRPTNPAAPILLPLFTSALCTPPSPPSLPRTLSSSDQYDLQCT